jgi:alpha-L-fucosidase
MKAAAPTLLCLLGYFTSYPIVSAAEPPLGSQSSAPAVAQESLEQFQRRMAWWREARFGLFIHWGIMSIPGRECLVMYKERITVDEYEKLVPRFNPEKFSAREIVSLARQAGQKYIVFVAKHHDGFCMWDSQLTDYDIMATPFKRDIVKELAEECGRQGLRFCVYYSILDWHHPHCRWQQWPKYVAYMKGQLRELLTGYGPIGVLWFDGEWIEEWTDREGRELYDYVRALQPQIIVNNRVGKGRQDMAGGTKHGFFPADFETPEQLVPRKDGPGADWESCMTINNSWSYTENDAQHKSVPTLLQTLAAVAAQGGNFLLNIGPRPDGSIVPLQTDRLVAIGHWLEVHGESISGTTGSPFPQPLPWGHCTRRPGRLYLHVFNWPADGKLVVPGLRNAVARAFVLSDPERTRLPVSVEDRGAVLDVPAAAPDPVNSVIVLELEGEPKIAPEPAASK